MCCNRTKKSYVRWGWSYHQVLALRGSEDSSYSHSRRRYWVRGLWTTSGLAAVAKWCQSSALISKMQFDLPRYILPNLNCFNIETLLSPSNRNCILTFFRILKRMLRHESQESSQTIFGRWELYYHTEWSMNTLFIMVVVETYLGKDNFGSARVVICKTTPKVPPPPPRRAKNKSEYWHSLANTCSPFGVTTSNSSYRWWGFNSKFNI